MTAMMNRVIMKVEITKMPTGYTAEICEKDVDFKKFVMTCAKAFVVSTRDDDINAPIPEQKPNRYNIDTLRDYRLELIEVEAWTEKRAEKEAKSYFDKDLESHNNAVDGAKAINDRITNMLSKVKAWKQPTDKHAALKKFMIDQLEETLKYEGTFTLPTPVKQSGKEFKENRIGSIKRSIKYYEERTEQDAKSAEESVYWLQKLKDSLKT